MVNLINKSGALNAKCFPAHAVMVDSNILMKLTFKEIVDFSAFVYGIKQYEVAALVGKTRNTFEWYMKGLAKKKQSYEDMRLKLISLLNVHVASVGSLTTREVVKLYKAITGKPNNQIAREHGIYEDYFNSYLSRKIITFDSDAAIKKGRAKQVSLRLKLIDEINSIIKERK